MKKLYIQLNGGLGNQLYIIATGRELAKKFGLKLIIETSIFNYYKLHKITYDIFLKDIVSVDKSLKIHGKNIFNFKKGIYYLIKEKKQGFDPLIYKKLNQINPLFNYYLKGYFQSLKYFKNQIPSLKEEIRKNILLENPNLENKLIKSTLEETLSIHIRRKDKLTKINKNIYGFIDINEIYEIIKSCSQKNKYKNILLIGDDDEFIEKVKKTYRSKFHFLTTYDLCKEKSITSDFYFLMNSKGLILNNSSFGLWAGYLSNSNSIFYPTPFFPYPLDKNLEGFIEEDLILPNWIKYKIKYSN